MLEQCSALLKEFIVKTCMYRINDKIIYLSLGQIGQHMILSDAKNDCETEYL